MAMDASEGWGGRGVERLSVAEQRALGLCGVAAAGQAAGELVSFVFSGEHAVRSATLRSAGARRTDDEHFDPAVFRLRHGAL